MPPVLPRRYTSVDVATLARERIADCFNRFDRVVVSFSGGKDSTVVLEFALEVATHLNRLPLEVDHWDEEAIQPETVDYVRRSSTRPGIQLRWFCYPVKHRNACSKTSPYWYPWAPEDKHLWCRDMPPEAVTRLPLEPGCRLSFQELDRFRLAGTRAATAALTGLRAQESLRRFQTVSRREHDNWICPLAGAPSVMLAKPIYDMTTEDVWTAPRLLGWDYNRAYDVMTLAGIARHSQRVCPPYGEEPLRGLWQYAQCWPELWDKMVSRVPGAGAAGRYARSPLYGYGDRRRDPPNGLTWEEAVSAAVMAWPESQRGAVVARLQSEISDHNFRTNNAPIQGWAPGIEVLTWSFLLMLATRGDFKGRRKIKSMQRTNDAASD